jgi:membrane-associated PAP2 superfamily phosphatase
MNRIGLLIAFVVTAVVGIVFGVYPDLDLKMASYFYATSNKGWMARVDMPVATHLRNLSSWLTALIAAPAFIALALKLLLPRRRMLMPGRAVVLMISTLVLAPGLVANVILKDNSGRPRPFFVKQFGGTENFVAWWDPRGSCGWNCSFVAGEPSGAFWTMAPAALAPPAWRGMAYGAALAFGAGVGLLRMAAGGHFFSDVVFAGFFVFLVIWLVHGLLYRWQATRITDDGVERALERFTMPVYDAAMRLAARIRGVTPRN